MKAFADTVTAAAVVGLVIFPGASGQSWRQEPSTIDMIDGEGGAKAKATTAVGDSQERRLRVTDEALDQFRTVSVGSPSKCRKYVGAEGGKRGESESPAAISLNGIPS